MVFEPGSSLQGENAQIQNIYNKSTSLGICRVTWTIIRRAACVLLWMSRAIGLEGPSEKVSPPTSKKNTPSWNDKPSGKDGGSMASKFIGALSRILKDASAAMRTTPTFWSCCPLPTLCPHIASISHGTGPKIPAKVACTCETARPEAASFSRSVSHRPLVEWNTLLTVWQEPLRVCVCGLLCGAVNICAYECLYRMKLLPNACAGTNTYSCIKIHFTHIIPYS